MTDEEIDYSDIPPLTEAFFEKATLRIPANQARNLVQLEPDMMTWFQAQSSDYKALINLILRRHIEANRDTVPPANS
ncbi:MAG: BrnA antitoxin family protein [Leptolyngbyaceae cyanobacterium SM1_3_5]|nr:BrnA antitoxin family protein [Leptolyngbyaceae cyanobacterium SM1_3_5]